MQINWSTSTCAGGALTDRVDAVYRRDGEWAAPYLWRSEVRNALARMIRDSKITMG